MDINNHTQSNHPLAEAFDWYEESESCTYPPDDVQNEYPERETGAKYGIDSNEPELSVWKALYSVRDPELPISIVDLGLIYNVDCQADSVTVLWTVTYSGCPGKSYIEDEMREAIMRNTQINEVNLETVYEPEWDIGMISPRGRRVLNDFGLSVPEGDLS